MSKCCQSILITLLKKSYLSCLVRRSLCPELNPVSLWPDVDRNAAYLIAFRELLANARKNLMDEGAHGHAQ